MIHPRFHFPKFRSPHRIRDINQELEDQLTLGQRLADKVAAAVGSWPFIVIQSVLLMFWILFNGWLLVSYHLGHVKVWDPYPFILLNLMLSFQAAYTGPVVMMSQNRQAVKDRLMAQHDYEINLKAEEEVKFLIGRLEAQ